MGLRSMIRGAFNRDSGGGPVSLGWQPGGAISPVSGYENYARAYTTNPIVFAALTLLMNSASEPQIIGRRLRRESPAVRALAISNSASGPLRHHLKRLPEIRSYRALGVCNRAGSMRLDSLLITNKFVEEVPQHPLVKILNNPNPMTSRAQMWAKVVMDYYLAGNVYLLKARGKSFGNVMELWRLHPARVSIVPNDSNTGIASYRYGTGNDAKDFQPEDVIHIHTTNPASDWYGMPPMSAAMGSVAIGGFMKGFLRKFFQQGGTGPGSIFSTTSKLAPEEKEEIRERFRRTFGGEAGWHEMLILDQTDSKYEQLGLDRGLRDALPKEISAEVQADISMVFGIPGSILGTLIGYESSSYANKRADWQVLWDIVMTPLLGGFDDVLTMSLVPEFGGIDDVLFDLSDIRALQEDEDALQERARKNFQVGVWGFRETRAATGVSPEPDPDEIFFIPPRFAPTKADTLGNPVEEAPPPTPAPAPILEPPGGGAANIALAIREGVAAGRGRPALAADQSARAVYERCEAFRRDNPRVTTAQIAGRFGISERQLYRYRAEFGS